MTRVRIGLILGLALVFLAQAAPVLAQKVGYIDPQRVLADFKPFQEAQRDYGKYEEELNREFTKLKNEFEKMKETYERQSLLLSDKRKKEEEESLMRKQQELQRMLEEITDPERGKLAQKQQELTAPILGQVNKMVGKIAQEEGYDFVLNSAGLVYANEDHDLTARVLEELKKKQEEEASAGASSTPRR